MTNVANYWQFFPLLVKNNFSHFSSLATLGILYRVEYEGINGEYP